MSVKSILGLNSSLDGSDVFLDTLASSSDCMMDDVLGIPMVYISAT